MSNGKSKIALAMGIFWIGIAIATAIVAYGTHAGARHPNPSIALITLPLAAVGLFPAFMAAKRTALIVLQVTCVLVFVVVVFAMDSKNIGPNWPAYTSVATAVILGAASVAAVTLMNFGAPTFESSDRTAEG